MNVGTGQDPTPARLARHSAPDVELGDFEPPDADVETGKNRSFLASRLEARQPDELDPLRRDALDLECVAEPCAGAPIQVDFGRGEKYPLLVRYADMPQLGGAKDRAVDPPNLKLEARAGLDPRDAVDDEAMTGRGIEQDQSAGEQEQQCDEQGEQLVEQALLPVAHDDGPLTAAGSAWGLLGDRFGHRTRRPARETRSPQRCRPLAAG
jgi:hypothetical protein